MRYPSVYLTATLLLASCCGLEVEYRRVGYSAKGAPDKRGEEQPEDSLQVFFTCPVDLSQIADADGLACSLEFPGLADLRGDGYVFRDLTDSVWQRQLPYHASDRPARYAFYADLTFMRRDLGWRWVELKHALHGRQFECAEVTIYGPGMLWSCPVSNVMRIAREELVDSLPRTTQQPAGALRGCSGKDV